MRKVWFELGTNSDGQYFFTAHSTAGELLLKSTPHLTRRAALEHIREVIEACANGAAVCYDKTRGSWQELR